MSDCLRVRWTIVPRDCPRPVLACPTCGGDRPYHPSGKLRLNANGKRLDVWLIYKCDGCDRTWNRPLLERRLAADIPAADLAALRSADPAFVRRLAFDLAALRRKTSAIVLPDGLDVEKTIIDDDPGAARVEIVFAVPHAVGTRLDRLLAAELGCPRGRIAALAEEGRLVVGNGRAALRRQPRDGEIVGLLLADVGDGGAIVGAARRTKRSADRDDDL